MMVSMRCDSRPVLEIIDDLMAVCILRFNEEVDNRGNGERDRGSSRGRKFQKRIPVRNGNELKRTNTIKSTVLLKS